MIVIMFGVFFTSGSKIRDYLNEAIWTLREKVLTSFVGLDFLGILFIYQPFPLPF